MRYLLQVNSKALPGREADYDTWYDNVHIHDVLALPGFTACTRFVIEKPGEAPEFAALYEVETDDPDALLQSLFAAAPNMQLTDAIDPASASFHFMRHHRSRVLAK